MEPGRSSRTSGWTVGVLSLAVGIVLADSAIVTLALPQILRELDVEVSEVAWVLTSFNLVLALAAVPAARLCVRGQAGVAGAAGLVVFAGASAGCALAPSLTVLIAARVAQALGGGLVIAACLELLVAATGDERAGAGRWAKAGVAGAAIGPVAGGLLTQAISWQSIFIVQVPLTLLAVPAALALRHTVRRDHDLNPPPPTRDRPHVAANLALACLSAALTAALFLLVLMLVEGWRRSPALAAVTVTAIPAAAFAAGPLARAARAGARSEAIAGSLLMAGGLGALALMPAADPLWTLAPQALVGLGLGLTVDSLTAVALRERVPRALHGGWTIAARHAGVVAGLAILTPIFTSDLRAAETPAQESIASLVIGADLPASSKLKLADGLGVELAAEDGRVPDLGPAFARANLPPDEQPRAHALERSLDDQLERAATRAFRDAFFVAAALALLALLPAAFLTDGARTRPA